MSNPSEQQLLRLVTISDDSSDLVTRVAHQFGVEHAAAALLLAIKTNGAKWVLAEFPKSLVSAITSAVGLDGSCRN